MLLLVIMEVFNRMLKKVKGAGLLHGFRADGKRVEGNVFRIFFFFFFLISNKVY